MPASKEAGIFLLNNGRAFELGCFFPVGKRDDALTHTLLLRTILQFASLKAQGHASCTSSPILGISNSMFFFEFFLAGGLA